MSKLITVIAVMTDREKAVFIDIDGKRHTMYQTDPRLAGLILELNPLLAKDQAEAAKTKKPQKGVQVDLMDYSLYNDFAEKSGGFIKFFKAAKSAMQKVVEYFVPEKDDSDVQADTKAYQELMDKQTKVALEEVIADVNVDPTVGIQPVEPKKEEPKRPRYDDVKHDLKSIDVSDQINNDETLVAVINGVVIPGIEALKPYISHALKTNSVKAVTAFLERVALHIDKRGHSIPDLMNFIREGDLPLAEDGCIIAYKVLNKNRGDRSERFTYVDCHSGKVVQRVGTFVRIPIEMVDPRRDMDCSHGLHVARRGYLGSFSGNVCTMIKMAPEDVIAVPKYNFNKVRCCGYKIIAELPDHVYNVLRSGRGMHSDPQAAEMLQKAISGDHIGVMEEVWVKGPKGTNLEIIDLLSKKEAKAEMKRDAELKVEVTEAAKTEVKEIKDAKDVANPVDPKELNKKIKDEVAKATAQASETLVEKFNRVIKEKDVAGAQEIWNKKAKAKKSWNALGLPTDAPTQLQDIIDGAKPKAETENVTRPLIGEDLPKVPEPKKKKAKPAPKPVPEAVVKAATKPTKDKGEARSVPEQAQDLFMLNDWAGLWALKKAKKKSWMYLGFTGAEIVEIEKHKP